MAKLTAVSETLYVPLLGRIYASLHHPEILYDKKSLSIADQLPAVIKNMSGQNEYTLLASAVRSRNMDYYLKAFLSENPDGVIVNIGCGLETSFYRNDNGNSLWFELDLPEVLTLREKYFPEERRDRYLWFSMFDYEWIEAVKKAAQKPVMIIASGLFYYFKEEQVIDFIRHLNGFNCVQLVFDAVSAAGIKGTKHYMKKMNRQDAAMFFSVDNATKFASKVGPEIDVLEERKFYSIINFQSNMSNATKLKMLLSDLFGMVKIVHLKIK